MLELEVSFAAFAVVLAGLAPAVVAELKHVSKLESRFKASNADRSGFTAPGGPQRPVTYYYVVPRPEPWAQKLSGTASVTTAAPTGGSATEGANYTVTLVSLEASPTVEDATATVQVTHP